MTSDEFDECVKLLCDNGIKVVAFDMDLTAVTDHSLGQLKREDVDFYLSKVSKDFVSLVCELYEKGFNLAIATHSDEAEFGETIKKKTHILGKELATVLLKKYFSVEIFLAFHIIAYNPKVREKGDLPENKFKRYHMREIQNYFNVASKEIVFFDDCEPIIKDCQETCGV